MNQAEAQRAICDAILNDRRLGLKPVRVLIGPDFQMALREVLKHCRVEVTGVYVPLGNDEKLFGDMLALAGVPVGPGEAGGFELEYRVETKP